MNPQSCQPQTPYKSSPSICKTATILDFAEELQTIADLQAVAPEQAAADWDAFSAVVSRLRDSHQINGIFCLTPQNQSVFLEFAGYLKTVASIAGQDAAPLCDGFDLTAAEIAAKFAAKPPAP